MGPLTFSINVTLDGGVDHQEGIADADALEKLEALLPWNVPASLQRK